MDIFQSLSDLAGKVNLTLVILTGALLMARVLPVIIFSPFLGGESVPGEVKIGLGLLITLVLFPGAEGQMQNIPLSAVPFVALMLKEVFIGLTLAFIVNMVFEAAIAAGTLIDLVGGSSSATMFLPELNLQVSLFANLKEQLATVLFLSLDGHHMVISSLADSVTSLPLDRFPEFSHGAWPFFDLLLRTFGKLFSVGIALASPAILVTMLVDLGLGMINRVAPQIQVYFIALSIKPLAAVTIMLFAIHLIVDRLFHEFGIMLGMFQEAIRLLS